jgi:2-oxo-4-hydroxy-4-carboxy-5-ureidoimidazoline decarboxylase
VTEAADRAVAALDAMPSHEAAALLVTCCGASAWVSGMLARRPFGTLHRLLAEADEVWWSLTPDDWLEAFAHHPRIGERASAVPQGERARAWSSEEQRGASVAAAGMRQALAEANREYEARFGHIYLVSASGKTGAEMLASLRERLANDPATELRVAAAEQAKITRRRLSRMLDAAAPSERQA